MAKRTDRRPSKHQAANVIQFLPPDIVDDRDVLLTRPEAAQYLRKSVPTLERWAREGIGPKPVKVNRWVHYRLCDLRDAAGGEAA
jgi:hypothetical protein